MGTQERQPAAALPRLPPPPPLPLLLLLLALAAVNGGTLDELTAPPATVRIHTSGEAVGPEFDGIGGLSAGAGTRLLVDYPETERGWVLDYLFSPSFGASLQVLKLEIGGTGDSTIGTEDSHERTRGNVNMTRGYELWFAQQALARNPDIILYGLAWTFPQWVEAAPEGFGAAAVVYLADWVVGMEATLDHELSYLGFHNESPWEIDWVVNLRAELNRRGKQHVQLVVADCGPNFQTKATQLTDFFHNKTTSATAGAVGLHYPNSILPARLNPEYYRDLSSLPDRQKFWSSEEFSTPATQSGGRCLAKLFNRNFLDGNLTSSIVWSIIYAWYSDLACSGQGLIWSPEPWSGKIGVVDTVWVAAHTTQFTKPGWRYIRQQQGTGYLPAQVNSDSLPRAVTMEVCQAGSASQRWGWSDVAAGIGAISNGAGRCLSLKGSSRLISEPCDPSEPEQRFRNHTAMLGHIEAASKPGSCLDMNAQAATAIVDTYACCCSACCCDCETWSLTAAGTMANTVKNQTRCVTEGTAERSAGAGSFVTLVPPPEEGQATDTTFTTVIETMDNEMSSCDYGNSGWNDIVVGAEANPVKLCYPDLKQAGACSALNLVLFYTNTNRSVLFEQQAPPSLDVECCVLLMLEANSLYTLSTVSSARKGTHPISSITPVESQSPGCGSVAAWTGGTAFPLPYKTTFGQEQIKFRDFAEYLSDMQGIFRVVSNPFADDGADSNNVLTQFIHASDPDTWAGLGKGVPPTALIGSSSWADYTVTTTARLAPTASEAEYVAVTVRMGHNYEFESIGGYKLALAASGQWWLNATGNATSLASGHLEGGHLANVKHAWQQLSLRAVGKTLTAMINGKMLATVKDGAWADGYAGLSTGWHAGWFRELMVDSASAFGPVVSTRQ